MGNGNGLLDAELSWKTVRVFVSSTFGDMHAERTYLVTHVVPRLRDWCERRRLQLVDIDLRWGVTEYEATRHKNVLQACLNRIDQCHIFVGFLGQRYGWIPTPEEVSAQTLESYPRVHEWLGRGMSATHMEIAHALMAPDARTCLIYTRDKESLTELPGEPSILRRLYDDGAEPDSVQRSRALEGQLALGGLAQQATANRRYLAEWLSNQRTPELGPPLECAVLLPENQQRWRNDWQRFANVAVPEGALEVPQVQRDSAMAFVRQLTSGRFGDFDCDGEALASVMVSDIRSAITQRFPENHEVSGQTPIEHDVEQHERFIFESTQGFIELPDSFKPLDDYVADDSRRLCAVHAKAGMGKSTWLANWIDRLRKRSSQHVANGSSAVGTTAVIARFVGKSDRSTHEAHLMHSVLSDLKERHGRLEGTRIPEDFVELHNKFRELLTEAATRGPIIVVLDGLNQLTQSLDQLYWLPRTVPENVKMIVSFKTDHDAGARLLKRWQEYGDVLLTEPPAFESIEARTALVLAHLHQHLKDLEPRHVQALVEMSGSFRPLFLKIVLHELRSAATFNDLGEKIRRQFGSSPEDAFDTVLARLEDQDNGGSFGPGVIGPRVFALLSHARHGLSLEELAEMIRMDLNLPEVRRNELGENVELCLKPMQAFMARREGRHDFFFETLRNAARWRFTLDDGSTTQASSAE